MLPPFGLYIVLYVIVWTAGNCSGNLTGSNAFMYHPVNLNLISCQRFSEGKKIRDYRSLYPSSVGILYYVQNV
jgi:hypothetical protein